MPVVSMKQLLEAGVHFGHRARRWNPKMRSYIFTERNGIHIIDLQQTINRLEEAYEFARDLAAEGGTILFVGTKKQAQETIAQEATRCGMPYVTERWLGGMLTNWSTMNQRIQELERLEQLRDSGEINRLTKKEGLLIEREITRLNTRLGGVRKMKKLPSLLFIIDVGREVSAVQEANTLNIPIVALVDTNCNPQPVDYVIPSNDDAIRAIKLLVSKMADAVLEGKALRKDEEPEKQEEVKAESKARVRATRSTVETEADDDAGDDILLGEATLAKMNVGKKVDVAIEDVVEEVKEKKPRDKKIEDVEESKDEE